MLSAYYLVQNEEEFLARSLASVEPFVDEIILIDNNSTDATPQIAQSHPKVQYHHASENIFEVGEHVLRERGLSLCKGDWILQIDGDVVLGNGWRDEVEHYLGMEFGWGAMQFHEHIGSYEHVHKALAQKTFGAFFRNHEGLKFTGGINKARAHGTLIESVSHKSHFHLHAGWFHYGYAKRDILSRIARNIRRGDWGQAEEQKASLTTAITSETEVWRRLPEVERAPYGYGDVPDSMKDLFGKTYWLDLTPEGKITHRHHIRKSP